MPSSSYGRRRVALEPRLPVGRQCALEALAVDEAIGLDAHADALEQARHLERGDAADRGELVDPRARAAAQDCQTVEDAFLLRGRRARRRRAHAAPRAVVGALASDASGCSAAV
jgi:hypothetical protein